MIRARPHPRTSSALFAIAIASFLSIAIARPARAQSAAFSAARRDHIVRQEAILWPLGAAALVSLGGGAWLVAHGQKRAGPDRDFWRSFGAFALTYGALNAAFVGANLAGLPGQYERISTPSLLDQYRHQQARAFAGNAGLDMIYITLGFTLYATDIRPTVRGMGASIALQGGFLLAFDGAGAQLMGR